MGTNLLKLLGIGITLLGALLLILGGFVFTDLLDQHFNWFILLGLVLVVGGLFTHIILNKRLPLDDEPEDK